MGEVEENMNYKSSSNVENRLRINEENFYFFQLPHPVQIDIISHLSLRDMRSFAETAVESRNLTRDQMVWKKKLWHHCKTINLCLEGRKRQPSTADFLVKDPLLVDMKKLYKVLNPEDACSESVNLEVSREGFHAKMQHPPPVMSFSSVGLQELLNFLNTFFHRPPPIFYDPFSRGNDAPSFLLFGPPETSDAKKLVLSFIASKNSVFETVGLVKGNPGGLGGGVTVEFGRRLMNLLPVRRARPRLLVEDSDGNVSFHRDVALVVEHVDGLIYYFDAKCSCTATNKCTTRRKQAKNIWTLDKGTEHPWQSTPSETYPKNEEHHLNNEFYELEAMIRATPNVYPPILVVLVHNKCPSEQSSSEDCEGNGQEKGKKEENVVHCPADLQHKMQRFEHPWMIGQVDVHSLKGVHQGINWLYERTRILKGK